MIVTTGQITIVDNNDGVSLQLTNDYIQIPTDYAGEGAVFDNTTSVTASVFSGGIDDSGSWVFSVVYNNVTCTEGAASRKQTLAALSADTGWITFTATKAGQSPLTKICTISKVKQGEPGRGFSLTASKQAFTYIDGILTPAWENSIVLGLRPYGGSITLPAGTPVLSTAPTGLFLAPMAGSEYPAYLFDASTMGDNKSVKITATIGAYTDSVTILRLDNTTPATAYSQDTLPLTPHKGDTWFYTGTTLLSSPLVSGGTAIPRTGYTWNGTIWIMTTPRGTYIGEDGIYTGTLIANNYILSNGTVYGKLETGNYDDKATGIRIQDGIIPTLSIKGGTLTSNNIESSNINGGTITGATIRTNATGVGVIEMSGNTMVVKDANGVIRVKLGYLG